jgi:hypothetical protein
MRNNYPKTGRAIYTALLPLHHRLLRLLGTFFPILPNKWPTMHNKRQWLLAEEICRSQDKPL